MAIRRIISRRQFLEVSAATILGASTGRTFDACSVDSSRSANVIAGAIRWDAWYAKIDASIAAQNSLSSWKYYKRAPFFCSMSKEYQINCVGTAMEMDAEIRAAVKGGLKYWAFDWYQTDSSLREAWNLYRQSSCRNLINWCGIVGLANLGSLPFRNNQWQEKLSEWAGYMREAMYQKVDVGHANRPLLYILWDQHQLKWYFNDELVNVRLAIEYLSRLLADANIGAPYVVILDATAGATISSEIAADAISNYISRFEHETVGSYADLDRQTRDFWEYMADTGVPTVPIIMVGWDTRARQERPVPWEHGTPNPKPTLYYVLPTPSELAVHVRAAVEFVHTHPTVCPSKALLIYSWDECDEGGGLIPNLGDPGGSYLSAIAPILAS